MECVHNFLAIYSWPPLPLIYFMHYKFSIYIISLSLHPFWLLSCWSITTQQHAYWWKSRPFIRPPSFGNLQFSLCHFAIYKSHLAQSAIHPYSCHIKAFQVGEERKTIERYYIFALKIQLYYIQYTYYLHRLQLHCATLFTKMTSLNVILYIATLLSGLISPRVVAQRAFFVFGDSLVDNGNNNYLSTSARADRPPYGIDSPNGPTGRFSNGLNIPDIICKSLSNHMLVFTKYLAKHAPYFLESNIKFHFHMYKLDIIFS